jgi:hypothetical protein
MVRHYYSSVQGAFLVVYMSASFESQVSGSIWQVPALMCGKSYEERSIVFLDVGQVSSAIVVPAEHTAN